MKGFSLIAVLLFIWIIISYIITGLTFATSIYGIGSFGPAITFGVLGVYAQLTVKYIYFVIINLIMLVIMNLMPTSKHVIAVFALFEIIAVLVEIMEVGI